MDEHDDYQSTGTFASLTQMQESFIHDDERTNYTFMTHEGGSANTMHTEDMTKLRRREAQTSWWRMVPPIISIPLRIITFIVSLPFAGTILAVFGWESRGDSEVLFNDSDGALLACIGIVYQAALVIPIIVNVYADPSSEYFKLYKGDLYGPWVFYPLASGFIMSIGTSYLYFRSTDMRTVRQSILKDQNLMLRGATKGALDIRKELKKETQSNSLLVLILGACIALIEAAFVRSCAVITDDDTRQSLCKEGYWFVFEGIEKKSQGWIWIVTIFWFVIFFTTHTLVIYAVLAHFQTMREVEEFTVTKSRPNSRRGKILKDLNEPKNLAVWAAVWELLVQDVKYKPSTRALTGVSFGCCCATQVLCWSYLAVRTVYQSQWPAEFTATCICLLVSTTILIAGFIRSTLRMDAAVTTHENGISRVQNEVQMALDHARQVDPIRVPLLTSKVRVLQCLDVYLRCTDSRPKLMGASLETLRWSGILVGLMLLNTFFSVLLTDQSTLCSGKNVSNSTK